MRAGPAISGAAHLAVLALVASGGLWPESPPPRRNPPPIAEVSLITEAELAAARMQAPEAPAAEAPQPATPPAAETPAPARPAPIDPAARSTRPAEAVDAASPDAPPQPPAGIPQADAQTEVAEPAMPAAEESPGAVLLARPSPEAGDRAERPRNSGRAPLPQPGIAAAPRVDTEAAPRPDPAARRDRTRRTQTRAEQGAPPRPRETRTTAPEEATAEIVTEAKEGRGTAAPTRSLRPRSRPARGDLRTALRNRQRERAQASAATTDSGGAEDATAAAIADAVARAQAEARAAPTPSGPPLTAAEKDALRVSVQKCWNVGALSSAALEVTVEVAVSMTPDGKPLADTIRLVGASGGSDAGVQQAFAAARRAILICGQKGYDLPPEKYDQWRDIVMSFNPSGMRMR